MRERRDLDYGDQSQTDGNLVRDRLALGPSDALQGFVIGCGDDDSGLFCRADGLVGLGRNRVSLASQAAARYSAGFSYCLPSSPSTAGRSRGSRSAPASRPPDCRRPPPPTPIDAGILLRPQTIGGPLLRHPSAPASSSNPISAGPLSLLPQPPQAPFPNSSPVPVLLLASY